MPYTPSSMYPTTLFLGQWSNPTAPNPRLAAPISAGATTITVTAPLLDYTGAVVTAPFIFGIENPNGYTMHVYAPAGAASADGLTLTGCVTGIRLTGLDWTTADTSLQMDMPQDAPVYVSVNAVERLMLSGAFTGVIASGGNYWKVGDGTATDKYFQAFNDHTSKPVFYFDDSAKRWKLSRGDDEGTAGDSELSGFMRLTTAEIAALGELPTGGIAVYNTDTGVTYWREGGAWVANAAGGTVANASTTVAGKVEEATQAEADAETTTGGTGARLFLNPSSVKRDLHFTQDYPYGESITQNQVVYIDSATAKWKKASASSAATCNTRSLAVASASGSTDAIANVYLAGSVITNLSGLTPGLVYLSDTAGAMSSTAGTNKVVLGYAPNATTLYFNPQCLDDATVLALNSFTPTSQSGTGSYSGAGTSGNIDISVTPFASTDTLHIRGSIYAYALNDDSSDQTVAYFEDFSGIIGGEYAGWYQTNSANTTTPPVIWAANAPTALTNPAFTITATSGTGHQVFTLGAPAVSGNNIRFAWTAEKTGGAGGGGSSVSVSIAIVVTKLK